MPSREGEGLCTVGRRGVLHEDTCMIAASCSAKDASTPGISYDLCPYAGPAHTVTLLRPLSLWWMRA